MTTQSDELFAALQRLLPQHFCSRMLARIAESRTPGLKNFLIKKAISHYAIDLAEALEENPDAYPSFNDFFTRQLKPDARPIDASIGALISPADGAISQRGQIKDDHIFQAKGHNFSVQSLLGCSEEMAADFMGGSFITIYLSPRDYHRVHIPIAGKLTRSCYIPGKLFSVNAATTRQIPGLFARNERLCCFFDTDIGQMAVILVGALFVAGIETQWQKEYTPGQLEDRYIEPALNFARGQEIGKFKFGSTVIVLTEREVQWLETSSPDSHCVMGEMLGQL